MAVHALDLGSKAFRPPPAPGTTTRAKDGGRSKGHAGNLQVHLVFFLSMETPLLLLWSNMSRAGMQAHASMHMTACTQVT